MTQAPSATLYLRSRWARRLGLVWFAAAAVWLVSDVVLWTSGGGVSWDALAIPVLVGIGVVSRRAGLEVDHEGFVMHEGLRSHRILWAAVDRVEVDWARRIDAPVRVHLRRDDHPLALHATWGLRRAEREGLMAVLVPALLDHGVVVEERAGPGERAS